MNREPIKISRDDLVSENVEGRLREQATVRSTKEHYERANVVAPEIAAVAGWRAWLLKSFVYLSLFGLIAGATAALIMNANLERPDRGGEAAELMDDLRKIDRLEQTGKYSAADASRSRERIREIGRRNTAFITAHNSAFTDASIVANENDVWMATLQDEQASRRADLLALAAAGLAIAAAIAAADRVIERDIRGMLIDAVLAGIGGAAIGIGVAALSPSMVQLLLGKADIASSAAARTLGHIAVFALFGAGVGAVPGLVTRDGRRAASGVVGGLVGGAIGGLAFDWLARSVGDATARFAVFSIIGVAIGLAMGWFEDAAKQGWLRVASGLIAGKQFILYRNPTFVGSAPMSHIYLFRDPQVGRRHAAIFHVVGGYEIENLPLGGPTLVNGQPVSRTRLRRGDRIGIGRTTLVFDEKVGS